MGRLKTLDSLRGVAALVVVIYHFSLVVPGVFDAVQHVYPLRIVTGGPTAVLVFFVLSGLVLYLSLLRHDRDGYLIFAVRRLTRLYLPVAAAVLLSAALYLTMPAVDLSPLKGWITRFSWTDPPSLGLLAGHLLLLDPDRFHSLDNPMWSLVVEVRLSLLFPLVAAGIRWRATPVVLGCCAVSWTCRYLMATGHQVALIDPVFTLQFLDLFAIGAALARHAEAVTRALRRVPWPVVAVVLLIALGRLGRFTDQLRYVGAILLVAVSFSYPSLARLYGLRPFVWLGDRSFSLYLVHVPLLLAIVHLGEGRAPIGIVLAAAMVVCLIGAELFWLAVERPAMRLGRRLSRRAQAGPRPDTIGS